jgi:hypothetical protein
MLAETDGLRRTATLQAAYILVTGLWPIVSRPTFEAVTAQRRTIGSSGPLGLWPPSSAQRLESPLTEIVCPANSLFSASEARLPSASSMSFTPLLAGSRGSIWSTRRSSVSLQEDGRRHSNVRS